MSKVKNEKYEELKKEADKPQREFKGFAEGRSK